MFENPESVGLYATRNFYITYHDWSEDKDVSLGVWHILPNYVARKFSQELGLDEVYYSLVDVVHVRLACFSIDCSSFIYRMKQYRL